MSDPISTTAANSVESSNWGGQLLGELRPNEPLITWMTVDLSATLAFSAGLLAVTGQRVLALAENDCGQQRYAAHPGGQKGAVRQWELGSLQGAILDEGVGAGSLRLLGKEGLLAQWRFTAKEFTAASRVVLEINRLVRADTTLDRIATSSVCPSCGAVLGPDETTCKICKPTAAPPPTKSLLRLAQFARPQAGMIAVGFVLTMLSTTAALAPPYIAISLIDQVLLPAWKNPGTFNSSLFIRCMIGMLLAAILAWLLRWGRTFILAGVSERVAANLRNVTYGHLQQLSLEFFGGKRTGDLMSRISTDTERLNNFLTLNLLDFATDLLMILLTTFILLSINPWLALATLTPIPFIAWLMHLVRQRLKHGFGRGARAWGEMVSVLADTIPGVRVVKAFAQEGREVERFRGANQQVLHANDGVNRVWSFLEPMVGLLTDLGNVVIWLAGAWFVVQGWATVGALQAFLVYIGRFYGRLDAMSRMMTNTQRAGSAANRIFEILDRVPSVAEPVKPVHPGRVEGRIELHDVKFQYGTRQVIKGVSLEIAPGEMIGLVGPSGAGKSTLVNLVCRFYDVMSGSILVDGVDIRSFPLAEYRRNIGIVLQEPFLFFGTVADNIAYARPEATRAQIIEAARAANAHDFILRLPDGYDSLVGERGQSLSGGERQRLSIARALLTDPKILILDEATSSVDTQTEREIQGALDALTRGRTTIAIAHRLSTLRSANRLIVMEDGQIVEMGNHDELIERAGAYFRLHQAQNEAAAEEATINTPL